VIPKLGLTLMGDASNPLSIVGVISEPVKALIDSIKKHREKEMIQSRFVNALETEASSYCKVIDKMSAYGKERINPKLLEIKSFPTTRQINELIIAASETPLLFKELIIAFINVAKACSEISENEAFMKSLEQIPEQFDFIKRMSDIYKGNNTVAINGAYFRYFKIYRKPFAKLKPDAEMSDEIEEIMKSLRLVKKWGDFAKKKNIHLNRKMGRRFLRNMETLGKTIIYVKIEASGFIDLDEYLPPSLGSLLGVVDGLS
jgi:hypothetical protein